MRKILIPIILCLLLSGCGGFRLPNLVTPKQPRTLYNYRETLSTTPKAVVFNGKVVVVEDTKKEVIVNYEKQEKQLTFIGRIGSWISGLGLIGFILLIIGLALAPGATIGFLFSLLGKWKRALRETVSAIKESKIVDSNREVENSLRAKQSKETRKIVGNIRAEL